MVAKSKEDSLGDQGLVAAPRSFAIAAAGVATGEDFAKLMSAVMSDVIEGRITARDANAVCNAGGKLLQIVEMQYRYASRANEARPIFRLV